MWPEMKGAIGVLSMGTVVDRIAVLGLQSSIWPCDGALLVSLEFSSFYAAFRFFRNLRGEGVLPHLV